MSGPIFHRDHFAGQLTADLGWGIVRCEVTRMTFDEFKRRATEAYFANDLLGALSRQINAGSTGIAAMEARTHSVGVIAKAEGRA